MILTKKNVPCFLKSFFLLLLLLLLLYPFLLFPGYKRGMATQWSGHTVGTTFDIDLMKSYLSVYADLSERLPVSTNLNEKTTLSEEAYFYAQQFQKTLNPKYFLIEFDEYPLTAIGNYLHDQKPNTYDRFNVTSKKKEGTINLVQLAAGRYEVPYSMSLFLGEIIELKDPNQEVNTEEGTQGPVVKKKQAGSAIMGHVFTGGTRGLIGLKLHDNRWIEYNYKVKGSNSTEFSKTQWNFQFGIHYNDNPLFINALVFQFGRDRASKIDPSLLSNLKIEYSFNIPIEKIHDSNKLKSFTSFQKFVIGKNYPFEKFILKIDFGIKWELYKASKDKTFNQTSLILAPNITW